MQMLAALPVAAEPENEPLCCTIGTHTHARSDLTPLTEAASAVVCCPPWQGACEMLFNPFKLWLTKGPFNRLFINYITNKHIKWYSKVHG